MTVYQNLELIDQLQDLFERRVNTNDILFRSTLKGEILILCHTFEDYTRNDTEGNWHEYAIINGCIILEAKATRWYG